MDDLLLAALLLLLAHSFGSSFVLVLKNANRKTYSALLAFSAGVMAFTVAEMSFKADQSSGVAVATIGILLGAAALFAADRLLPHVHLLVRKKKMAGNVRKATLFAGTITLQNMPEGFAVAAAFAASTPLGWLVASSIALQDIPEGFLVAAPLACFGVKARRCLEFGVFSGLVEAAAAVLGFVFLSLFTAIVPLALALSSGAIAYLIVAEMLPEALTERTKRAVGVAFLVGILFALTLAALFGF